MCRVRRVSTGTATTPTEGPAPGADVDQASGSSSETSDTPLTMAVTVSATALPAAVFVKNFELDIIKRRWFLGLCPLVNIIIRPPPSKFLYPPL